MHAVKKFDLLSRTLPQFLVHLADHDDEHTEQGEADAVDEGENNSNAVVFKFIASVVKDIATKNYVEQQV